MVPTEGGNGHRQPLLHVGYAKTGSTWLQKSVFGRPDGPFLLLPLLDALEYFVFRDDAETAPGRIAAELAGFRTRADAADAVPVVSHEVLVGDQTQGRYWGHQVARRLQAVFPDGRVLMLRVDEARDPGLHQLIKALLRSSGCGALAAFPLQEGAGPVPTTPADIVSLYRRNGLSLTSTFVVKFQQYDNYPISTDGFAFDDITVQGSAPPPDAITVTAPNGGENFTAGDAAGITWSWTGTFTTVSIDYSTNGGSSWTSITGSTANDGSYTWTVPAEATTQGRVRVSGGTASDASNSNFTITVPSGGDRATVPYSTGFESGAVDSYWTTASTGNGRVLITSANSPHSGSYQMTMDTSTSGSYATNEAWLLLDLAGQTDVVLDFWWKEFGDETHSTDGVYFSSNDGASFVKVQNLNGASYANNTWQHFTLDLDALASANGLALNGSFVVKFQQYDNYPIATDGFAFDDISVTAGSGGGSGITAETEPNGDSSTANGPVGDGTAVAGTISSSSDDDWFYLDVATAGNINISVAIGSSADLDWYLYNSSLTEVARGYTTSNPEAGSYNAAAGHYYLRVDGYLGATSSYTLTVAGGLARFMPGTPKTVPAVFALGQNHPNPFNPKTTIRFSLPDAGQARLFVFDVNGRQVATLIDEHLEAGEHTVDWNGRDDAGVRVSSGVYFYRLDAPDHTQTRKMLLLQ